MVSSFSHQPNLDRVIEAIDYTPEEWESFLQQFCQEDSYQGWLHQQGVTAQEFETWVRRELAIRKFQQRQWGKKVISYFLDRKYALDQVICSLIYVHEKGLAQELYFRIAEAEATFAALALAHSRGAEASQGGRVGPIALGQLHPHLARLFYGAQPGQLWEPLQIESWWVVARLEESLPAQFDDFMRQSLLNELLEAWLQEHG